jgi:outer membrane biosynthesis protein TonB
MNYQQASEVRGRGLLGNITDNLVSGQSIGKSFGRGISDTFKAKSIGVKEKFDPIRLAKKMTGNLGGALVGRLLGRKKEDMQHFLGGQYGSKSESTDGFGNVSTAFFSTVTGLRKLESGDSVTDVASKLFAFMEKTREDKKRSYELSKNFEEESLVEDELNHKKLIKAIEDTKKIPEEKKPEEKKPEEKKKSEPEKKRPEKTETKGKEEVKKEEPKKGEPTKPSENKPAAQTKPVETTPSKPVETAKPAIKTKPPETTTPVSPAAPATTGISTAVKIGAGVAAGGIGLSAAAKLSLKAEQGVKSTEDALQPNNDPKRVQKGEFSDPSIPKVGAATPDVSKSTSYGLFGINNIRSKGKDGKPIPGTSTMDAFIKDNPQLNLPDPGSNLEPEVTKKFNQAWWQVSKQDPKGMLKSQLDFYKNKFENPAIESLNKAGISKEIANNPGVQVYMVDRKIAYGSALLDKAMNYAKDAKTPKEFIRLISEFDDTHLRLKNSEGKNIGIYGDKTSDEKYKEIEHGLHNRIQTRTAAALEHVNDVGSNLNQSSVQNKDIKQQAGTTVMINKTQNTIIKSGSHQQPQVITPPTNPDKPMMME